MPQSSAARQMMMDEEEMGKGHTSHKEMPSKMKAKKILHEGIARGHKLTEKQRKFFGARASGMPLKKK